MKKIKIHLVLIFTTRLTLIVLRVNLFVCLAFSNCLSQEKISFDFGNKEILKPTILPENSILMTPSPDNSAISTLFDNFTLNLQSAKDALTGAVTIGFSVPIKIPQGKHFIYYIQNLRGAITKDKNARIMILIDFGDKPITIVFPYGQKYNGDLLRSFPRKVKTIQNLNYSISFSIFVERRNITDIAFIQLDSFDLAIDTKNKKINS